MTVGERIKELRIQSGLSQVDFADKINVSKQTLYKYENNIITNIPYAKIEAAAKLGNVSPSYLMGWPDNDFSINYTDNDGKQQELLIACTKQLSNDNLKRLIAYAQKLLDLQKMDEYNSTRASFFFT